MLFFGVAIRKIDMGTYSTMVTMKPQQWNFDFFLGCWGKGCDIQIERGRGEEYTHVICFDRDGSCIIFLQPKISASSDQQLRRVVKNVFL